jgi:[pyruvate, water dikinase]-phosphate phosphotransferase / [pyruvate, water dikinase] kinase
MSDTQRAIFFVSDGTGITAEMLGHSMLSQFDRINFQQTVMPFIDTVEKAHECRAQIEEVGRRSGTRPIVFTTLVNQDVRVILGDANCLVLDFFERFIGPLEGELETKSSHTIGRSHAAADRKEYQDRIEAINFALAHDDGVSDRDLDKADVILIGVSRSGKTPTCLYLALQFGVKAANCPLIPEDFERNKLPTPLEPFRDKLYGLTIVPERLREIRQERRPGSKYADLENCRDEVKSAEELMRRHSIRMLNSTTRSIEEIATKIIQDVRIVRRVF